ncbi:YtrH family sporulation protein [Sulfobacillus thermosulfidooxidans]|uniref:Sporulation protein YtrH n=1 Tax=Sulfobacillus thermosulfidooxidans (strain DSM 9293 / VKM B-1269 / AT-1) TaxID=929705 RepID=A0A1W1WJZ3_SULTA|nr:YtrH family sporulation protein [Sulfobacillus thermosulfidooxidans]SMC06634.1 Sporulation protein YtrH [Sulfobacillus thermosulfidooxidans DSM 9293]
MRWATLTQIWPDIIQYVTKLIRVGVPPYFLALGVTLGGGLLGALGLWMAGKGAQDPASTAYRIRIWAVAIAIGGTLTALENLERGLSARAIPSILRDGLAITMAYFGAQSGYWLLSQLGKP